ncbi:hypothetical protein [Bacillus sp. KH172YL63]|uniref:hypothetical protein n=1 Tax=Bacillus sp. KH172YL63 TaxID=2709784 RepID=UPI0013E4988B|nr:hypothetical protein [Bacillus sp. KH172YL63]BCB04782.1 hypothetical protein KH172YL63_29150 [Bacillus sp. KH172YL63]
MPFEKFIREMKERYEGEVEAGVAIDKVSKEIKKLLEKLARDLSQEIKYSSDFEISTFVDDSQYIGEVKIEDQVLDITRLGNEITVKLNDSELDRITYNGIFVQDKNKDEFNDLRFREYLRVLYSGSFSNK